MVKLNIDLPESFFQEEERDGYFVSAKMKQLWAVQLDLLNEFDRVCKKYGLKYILDFGTLLGAIRHKGFIPWDDDLDVSMLREDYDKLMEVGPREFKEPYFLQTCYTDKGFNHNTDKLRRTDTAFMEDNVIYQLKYNQGIFIDLFVFDHLDSKSFSDELMAESSALTHHIRSLGLKPTRFLWQRHPKKYLRYLYYRMRYGSIKKEHKRLEQLATQFTRQKYVGNIMSGCTRCRPIEWFEETINVPFENLILPVPSSFDALLNDTYGDYMIPVMGTSAHTVVYYDSCRSYKDVLKDKDLMRRLRTKILGL